MTSLKRTPLFEVHRQLGGKMVPFAGWEMPVQYTGIIDETKVTRTKATLFDIAHMGQIQVTGSEAEEFLQRVVTNDVSRLKVNQAQYTFLCRENGGTIDDILVYRLDESKYLLVVNASNADKDFDWLTQQRQGNVQVDNLSAEEGQLALQGPAAAEILAKLTDTDIAEIKYFMLIPEVEVAGVKCLVSRTGYTGEDGFELYSSREHLVTLWEALLEAGATAGLIPAGLGARDVLRLEAGLPLYGNELDEDISPLEAGQNFFVKLDKNVDFIGKAALQKQLDEGLTRRLVGFETLERAIPRGGYDIFHEGENIGQVTSGSFSPTLGKVIGFGFVNPKWGAVGTELAIQVRRRLVKAQVVSLPFYRREK